MAAEFIQDTYTIAITQLINGRSGSASCPKMFLPFSETAIVDPGARLGAQTD